MRSGYTEADRAAHYGGTVERSACVVCLLGMSSSHGHAEVEYRASDGVEGPHGVTEATEPPVCYCGSGYEGHDARHPRRPREGYQFKHVKRCRGCTALIAWWETPAGKWSPHDFDGVSHFATCPVHEQFRKSGTPTQLTLGDPD